MLINFDKKFLWQLLFKWTGKFGKTKRWILWRRRWYAFGDWELRRIFKWFCCCFNKLWLFSCYLRCGDTLLHLNSWNSSSSRSYSSSIQGSLALRHQLSLKIIYILVQANFLQIEIFLFPGVIPTPDKAALLCTPSSLQTPITSWQKIKIIPQKLFYS